MTWTIVSTDETTQQTLTTSGDVLTLSKEGSVLNSGGSGIASNFKQNDMTVFVYGEVIARNYGVNVGSDLGGTTGVGSNEVYIGASGSVTSMFPSQHAVFAVGTDNKVVNEGTLAARSMALRFYGSNNEATNSGTMTSVNTFAIQFDDTVAGGTSLLSNSGLISGLAGVSARFESLILSNTGHIKGTTYQGVFINEDGHSLDLENHGIIESATNASIQSQDGNDTVANHGTLIGTVNLDEGNNTFTNTANLYGDYYGGSGVDQISNSGLVSGDLYGGGGNDTIDTRGGETSGVVYGGMGDDDYYIDDQSTILYEAVGHGIDDVYTETTYTLLDNFENAEIVGDNNATAIGNGASNFLTGNSGDNWLRGLGAGDYLFGNDGEDVLIGGTGVDALFGGSDNDRIYGGTGNDSLYGGGGADIIVGGLGADIMYGGGDEDTFLFSRVNHSPKTGGNDVIKNFELNTDAIDISAFNANFIGAAAFSGTAAEVRITTSAGSNTVWLDTDANGFADMKILVQGVTALNVDDFIL